MSRTRRNRLLFGTGVVATLFLLDCRSGTTGGTTATPQPPNGAFSLTGRTLTIPLTGLAIFDVVGDGDTERLDFTIDLFAEEPTDSPSACTLVIDPLEVQVTPSGTDQPEAVSIGAYMGSFDLTAPCNQGEYLGSFALSIDGDAVSNETSELAVPDAVLPQALSGSFSVCLVVSCDAGARISINELDLRFGPSSSPGHDDDADTAESPGSP